MRYAPARFNWFLFLGISIPLVLLFVSIVYIFSTQENVTVEDTVKNITSIPYTPESTTKETQMFWKERIRAVGEHQAYGELKRAYQGKSADDQHFAAHLFGGELYQTKGIDGLSICDATFSYGCYHEFLGRAIAVDGLSVVPALNESCRQNLDSHALSCQHGIGHGLLTYAGYELEDLKEALSYCKDLPYNNSIGGCYGGVFMEYNMRTMLSVDGIPPREYGGATLEDAQVYEPCTQLPSYASPACYYWQPQWWNSVLRVSTKNTTVERYEKMGDLCDGLEGSAFRRLCFEGLGNITVLLTSDPQTAADFCNAAASDTASETYCRADAANSFAAVPELSDSAHLVCEGLVGENNSYCLGYSKNIFNKVQPASLPNE